MYKVFFKKSAIKELKKIPKKEQILITKTIKTFSDDPHPVGHKKLVGEDITYRVRVGNYRIIYDIYDNELYVEIIRVRHRKEAYR